MGFLKQSLPKEYSVGLKEPSQTFSATQNPGLSSSLAEKHSDECGNGSKSQSSNGCQLFALQHSARGKTLWTKSRCPQPQHPRSPAWFLRTSNVVHYRLFLRRPSDHRKKCRLPLQDNWVL